MTIVVLLKKTRFIADIIVLVNVEVFDDVKWYQNFTIYIYDTIC